MYFRVYVFNFLGKLGFNVLKYILEKICMIGYSTSFMSWVKGMHKAGGVHLCPSPDPFQGAVSVLVCPVVSDEARSVAACARATGEGPGPASHRVHAHAAGAGLVWGFCSCVCVGCWGQVGLWRGFWPLLRGRLPGLPPLVLLTPRGRMGSRWLEIHPSAPRAPLP